MRHVAVKWKRTSARCPHCGKGPGLRVSSSLSKLMREITEAHGVNEPVLSYKCQGCRKLYALDIETVALLPRQP